MSQYSLGTVSVINGSPVVTGVGTSWSSALAAGQLFALNNVFVWYTILSVNSDTQITLTGNYVGATTNAATYIVQRDFTPNNNYPIPSYGDTGSATLIAQTLLQLDAELAALSVVTQTIQGNIVVDGQLTISGTSLGYANVAISASTITASTVDSSAIGATTPSTGTFTNLRAVNSFEMPGSGGYQGWNAYYNAGVWTYRGNDFAYVWENSGNQIGLYYAASGVAGATVSFNPAILVSGATGVVSFPAGALPSADWSNNRIINGGFDIWQNGTSFSVLNNTGPYFADQWIFHSDGPGSTFTVSKTAAFANSENSVFMTGAMVAGSNVGIDQPFEAQMIADLDGQAITVSFDLNASTTAGTLSYQISLSANTAVDNGTFSQGLWGSPIPVPAGSNRITQTIPAAHTVGLKYGAKLIIYIIQNGVAGTVTAYIGAVKLEKGTVATPYAPKPMWAELTACQRYYQTSWPNLSLPANVGAPWYIAAYATVQNTYLAIGHVPFKPQMRTTPTMICYDQNGNAGNITLSGTTSLSATFGGVSASGFTAIFNTSTTTYPAGNGINLHWSASARL